MNCPFDRFESSGEGRNLSGSPGGAQVQLASRSESSLLSTPRF